ncbi:MAD2L1-binding protein-like [Sinocyclocheilus rhinocerous]|uniref:MAD2L1-binding protein-like n=1 Tax=Sinocyclocheilus rhinocerous TaxID=307959 RepID=A0A673HCW7_9TELE|nr:PREDICTED: MAD2L1-binding protein-like [Sinocyclocheilus rhinocerous]
MEEGSKRREFERANMTVIKHSKTNLVSNNSYNNTIIHTDQCIPHEEESKVSSDGEKERNILCQVDDDPESSAKAKVGNLYLLDNIGEIERDRELLNPSENKENRNSPTHARTEHRGDDHDGCQQMDALASSSGIQRDCESSGVSANHVDDEEIFRRAREEGRVNVVFPGRITQDGCCRFVCELLKCVLYQRQQMPMTYDQMVFLQKQQHNATQTEDTIIRRSGKTSEGLDWRRCQRTLQELDEVLAHLEALFSLSQVRRVLFMLGGSTIFPTELYEVNMEAVAVGAGENSLRTSTSLRQIFRTLFVADLLSDAKSVRLMTTTVMALGHRDCGVTGFKPKMDFKVPTKVKRQVISIASDLSLTGELQKSKRDLEDYIWFQAPVTVKGFCK